MKLSWQRMQLHLHHPFNIARTSLSDAIDKEVLLVKIEHDDKSGWGEAAPVSYYHQSLDSAETTLDEAARMLGNDPFALDTILDRLRERFPHQPAAVAAVDGALHDLIGKLLGLPVWRYLGLNASCVPLTSFTIGIDNLSMITRKVHEAADYPILKVKIGTDDDLKTLTAIRNAAPEKTLRVDINCGWSSDSAFDRCRALRPFNVELIEQPTPANDHEHLKDIRDAEIAPLIADESCINLDDVLPCRDFFDGINIKLCKCGGIRQAMRMIHVARAAGLRIMLGCMVETSVGIAAAAQLAPLVDYLDLDGHLLLADDPFEGIGGSAGRLTLNHRPGMGIVPRTT